MNCSTSEPLPPIDTFLRNLPSSFLVSLGVATIVSIVTVCVSILQIHYIWNYISQVERRLTIGFLAALPLVVSIFSLLAMFMPRVSFLSHLVCFQCFTVAFWLIIVLFKQIYQEPHSLLSKLSDKNQQIELATPPFCCVLSCLPTLPLSHRNIRNGEWMVLQSPLIRTLVTIVSLAIFFESKEEGLPLLKLIDLFAVPSLLVGIYGTRILVTAVAKLEELHAFRYVVIFRLLDLFLMFYGLQQPIFDALAAFGAFGCGSGGLPALETAYFWKNFAVVLECLLMALLATILLHPSRSAFFDQKPTCTSSTGTVGISDETFESSNPLKASS